MTGRNCGSITQQKQLIATGITGFSTPGIALGPKQQSEHEARDYGADHVLRIVPSGPREMRIGKETAIIVETERVLAGPPDHEGVAEHSQYRPIGERGKKDKGGREQRQDREPLRAARREALQQDAEIGTRRFRFRRAQ